MYYFIRDRGFEKLLFNNAHAFILRFSRTGNVMQQETVTSLLGFGVERHLHNLKPVQD